MIQGVAFEERNLDVRKAEKGEWEDDKWSGFDEDFSP